MDFLPKIRYTERQKEEDNMSLGENIIRLRSASGLSQEDLAEKLGVSRQSVSKWETDASVPDLDKLVKLSEVFHISLDELVKGEHITDCDAPAAVETPLAPRDGGVCQAEPPVSNGNRAAGLIYLFLGLGVFLALAMLGGAVAGLIFALPFLVCGVLCLVLRARRMGLWCGWGLYLLTDLYFRYATGLQWSVIFMSFQWSHEQNYTRLFIAWVQFLLAALLIVLTVLSYRKEPLTLDAKGKRWFILGWVGVALLWLGGGAVMNAAMHAVISGVGTISRKWGLFYTLMRWVRDSLLWVLLAVLLSVVFRVWKTSQKS